MKKLLLALMLCLVSISTINASEVWLSGYLSQVMVYYNGDWQTILDQYGNPAGYGVAALMTDDGFTVRFANKPEVFTVYNASDIHYNTSGHQEITADAVDQDGIVCVIRLVFRNDPRCEADVQLYVHYADIDYVYNMIVTANHMNNSSGGNSSGQYRGSSI